MNISELKAMAALANSVSQHADVIRNMQSINSAIAAQRHVSSVLPEYLLDHSGITIGIEQVRALAQPVIAANAGVLQTIARQYAAAMPLDSFYTSPSLAFNNTAFQAAIEAARAIEPSRTLMLGVGAQVQSIIRDIEATLAWRDSITQTIKAITSVSDVMRVYRTTFDSLVAPISDILEEFEVEDPDLDVTEVAEAVEVEWQELSAASTLSGVTPTSIDIDQIVERIVAKLPQADTGKKLRNEMIITSVMLFIITELFKAMLGGVFGGVAEVEYERSRNADEDAENARVESEQTRIATAQLEAMQKVVQMLEHPPHRMYLVKRAHLRRDATSESESQSVIPLGTEVTEIRRENGWAEITVESEDGFLETGWVYARFLRPVVPRDADDASLDDLSH